MGQFQNNLNLNFSATVVAELVGFPDKQSQQLVCLL